MRLANWFQVTPAQVAFIALAVAALWLGLSASPLYRFYGCMAGLATQPYWFSIGFKARNGAVLVASFLYTGAWIHGAWLAWGAM